LVANNEETKFRGASNKHKTAKGGGELSIYRYTEGKLRVAAIAAQIARYCISRALLFSYT
jgi:hypothetical protein